MNNIELKSLEKNGFTILKRIHLILVITSIIISFIVSAALFAGNLLIQNNKIASHEKRLQQLEILYRQKHDLLLEIKFNLKTLMEENGLKYHSLTSK